MIGSLRAAPRKRERERGEKNPLSALTAQMPVRVQFRLLDVILPRESLPRASNMLRPDIWPAERYPTTAASQAANPLEMSLRLGPHLGRPLTPPVRCPQSATLPNPSTASRGRWGGDQLERQEAQRQGAAWGGKRRGKKTVRACGGSPRLVLCVDDFLQRLSSSWSPSPLT